MNVTFGRREGGSVPVYEDDDLKGRLERFNDNQGLRTWRFVPADPDSPLPAIEREGLGSAKLAVKRALGAGGSSESPGTMYRIQIDYRTASSLRKVSEKDMDCSFPPSVLDDMESRGILPNEVADAYDEAVRNRGADESVVVLRYPPGGTPKIVASTKSRNQVDRERYTLGPM